MVTTKNAKKPIKVGSAGDEGALSDDFMVDTPVEPMNLLQELANELANEAKKSDLVLRVPGRPNITLTFDPNIIEYEMFKAWGKRATVKEGKEKTMDPMKFAFIALSNTNTEIRLEGQLARDMDGTNLTLASAKLHGMLGVPAGQTVGAIKRLFGNDADIIGMSNKVIEAAGYGQDNDFEADEDDSPLDD